MIYTPIIGLEVHVELATLSKMFCGCPAEYFGHEPNTHTCPVCLGFPGALPVPNRKAVDWTILLGLALGCHVNLESKFDRKNYFYPDLPKGYQISQYDQPLCEEGNVTVRDAHNKGKTIRIRRVHIEEDTGKLVHAMIKGEKVALVDLNRSGVPLVEIVTDPDFRTVDEVDQYVKKLQQLIRYLSISGADMEKGTMRLEPSISLATTEEMRLGKLPDYRVELKNINSFRFARRAIEYEITRQSELLDRGEHVAQQTRGWSEDKNATVAQREKEEANDYRYFPEPDIPPMRFTTSQITNFASQLPELPGIKKERFISTYELNEYDASLLTESRELADYFEEAVKVSKELKDVSPKKLANWIINKKIDISTTLPATVVKQIRDVSSVQLVDGQELAVVIEQVVKDNQKAVEDYKKGKEQSLMFLLGQVMRNVKADAPTVIAHLKKLMR